MLTKMTKDKKRCFIELLSCDNLQSIVKLSLFVSFLVATSQNITVVSLPGILQTKCRNWRAQWNTTRRNWRTWDSSGDRYTVTHRQQQQPNMLLRGVWLSFSFSIQYPLVCKKQHILLISLTDHTYFISTLEGTNEWSLHFCHCTPE